MSFGKELSPQKEFVDQAVKYAEEKGGVDHSWFRQLRKEH